MKLQRRSAAKETADFADLEQIEGVLAHAGLPGFWKSQRAQRSQRTKSAPAGRRTGRRPSSPLLSAHPSPSPAWRALARRRRARVVAARAITKAQSTTRGTKSFGVSVRHVADVPRVVAARAITKAQSTTRGTKSFGVPVRHVADVPRVQGELPPAGVQGAAPLAPPIPIPHFPFPLCVLCVLCVRCDFNPHVLRVPLCVLRALCDLNPHGLRGWARCARIRAIFRWAIPNIRPVRRVRVFS